MATVATVAEKARPNLANLPERVGHGEAIRLTRMRPMVPRLEPDRGPDLKPARAAGSMAHVRPVRHDRTPGKRDIRDLIDEGRG